MLLSLKGNVLLPFFYSLSLLSQEGGFCVGLGQGPGRGPNNAVALRFRFIRKSKCHKSKDENFVLSNI